MSKYYMLLLLTSALWGGNFVASKLLVAHASPLTLTFIRWTIAVLFLFPIVLKKERSVRLQTRGIVPLIAMGMSGVVLFNVFMFQALRYTSADHVGLISTLNPMAIALVAYVVYRDKLTLRQWVAMVVSLIGVLIVMTHGQLHRLADVNIGDVWMIGAVIIWGVYSSCAKAVMTSYSPLAATFWSGVFGVIGLLPFLSSFSVHDVNVSFLLALLYTSVGATVLAMFLWNVGVKRVGATTAGMFLNFNPLFTALFAYILLGETLTPPQWIGSFVTIAGVILFTKK
ncbi:drug/metabolite transporter (DMT)-like permease [Anoxybacillus kamchatkensis]|uniref:DMT family transporter n=1 Tax=Anoxybacillus ayderensis TaxID=265546 RepID=UPI0015EC5CBE|nr:DMT family transporter [Anoxybacillus ayderensis]MBA2877719.1 drug/metabolite transporter (DMT)-like permease [Anoxybacillus ayderensis]